MADATIYYEVIFIDRADADGMRGGGEDGYIYIM